MIAEGGCHCGKVRFRVELDLSAPVHDCNCSICAKKGFLHISPPPAADGDVGGDKFALLAGADALSTYTFNTGMAKHTFCKTCGMHPFYTPRSQSASVAVRRRRRRDVNARCLDDYAKLANDLRIERFYGDAWEENVDAIR